jgi:pimeloyl-ACP methyl ester carboxylesterase
LDGPATVFGSSSGAIVALEVLARHESVVQTPVPHEPPAVRLLADGEKWVAFFAEVYDLYREAEMGPAIRQFAERVLIESDRVALARTPTNEYTLANRTYWFEHELRQYPGTELDIPALRSCADRIVLTAGRESRGHLLHEISLELAKRLAVPLIELPGAHLGMSTGPAEFASELVQALPRA